MRNKRQVERELIYSLVEVLQRFGPGTELRVNDQGAMEVFVPEHVRPGRVIPIVDRMECTVPLGSVVGVYGEWNNVA